jgi:LysR family glycine cleavage system transcriptional activator
MEAVLAGQGIALCSDVLLEREFRQQLIAKISDLSLPGYGFFVVDVGSRTADSSVGAFKQWIRSAAAT